MEIKIVIPSAGRPYEITAHTLVPNAIICIPESQYAEYKKAMPKNTVFDVHPDDMKGLWRKRNYIVEKYKNVFMLDDDVIKFIRMLDNGRKVPPKTLYDWIQKNGNVAKDIGCYLFGFANMPSPLMYWAQAPIKLTGFINASAMGILEGLNIPFEEKFEGANDYYISAMNAYVHRMCYIDTRIAFGTKPTFKGAGGMASIRTRELDAKLNLQLKEYFGEAIRTKKGNKNYRVKSAGERSLHIPY